MLAVQPHYRRLSRRSSRYSSPLASYVAIARDVRKNRRYLLNLTLNLLVICGLLVGPLSAVSPLPAAQATYAANAKLSSNNSNPGEALSPATSGAPSGNYSQGVGLARKAGDGPASAAKGPGTSDVPFGNIPEETEMMGGCNPVEYPTTTSCGQPVNTATGNFWHTFTELFIPGRGSPLEFSMTYNSLLASFCGLGCNPNNGTGGMPQNLPLGYGWTHNYNLFLEKGFFETNYYTQVGAGNMVVFGGIDTFSAPSRVLATLAWGANDSLVLTKRHGQEQLTYAQTGTPRFWRLAKISDRNGYETILDYDTNGRLQTVTDASEERTLTFTYGSGNLFYRVTQVTDDKGNRSVLLGYDSSGQHLVSVTDVANNEKTFTYDSGHHLLTMRDANTGLVTNDYDTAGRAIKQTDAMSRTLQFEYSTGSLEAHSTRITDTLNLVTVHNYTFRRLSQVVENASAPSQQQNVWNFEFDANPHFNDYGAWLKGITDPNGHSWAFTWDGNAIGNVVSVRDPLSHTTNFYYNSTNDLTTITHTNGLTTSFGYDGNGNLTSVTQPLTETGQLITTSLTYDPSFPGDVLTMTNPLNKSWGIRYDKYGYPTTIANPLGETSTHVYNALGWLLSVTNPRTYTTTFAYNNYGDSTVITDTRGYTTTYTYDNNRNLKTVTDANHKTITNTYNLNNEITRTTRPDGTYSSYEYDGVGRVVTQTNGLGQATRYGYDDVNRRTTVTDALTRTQQVLFDPAGNISVLTDALGMTTTFGYDAANQLILANYSDSNTHDVQYRYNDLGLRTAMTDGIGTTLYTYDSLSRLKSVTDGHGRAVSYAYDLASRLTTLTYPNIGTGTRAVNYEYDYANRMTSVSDWFSNTTSFDYDANSNLTSISRPNTIGSIFSYNQVDQLTELEHGDQSSPPLLTLEYSRNKVGAITSALDNSGNIHNYEYDLLYRLSGDDLAGAGAAISQTYTFNAATDITHTNHIEQQGPLQLTTSGVRAYDAANQLTTIVETTGSQTTKNLAFTFNNNGNRTQQTNNLNSQTTNYTYDQANLLVDYNGVRQYRYNGDGLRMSKIQGNSTEQFTWDAARGLPLLLQDGTASFVYGPGGMLVEEVMTSDDSVLYFHQDQLGSVRVLSNSDGKEVNYYDYDAYGNLFAGTANEYNPFGYAGEYTDAESGLIYLRARYYDPQTQQFLTVDPMLASTEQAYAYAAGSPTNFVDPSGLNADDGIGLGTPSNIPSSDYPYNGCFGDMWYNPEDGYCHSIWEVEEKMRRAAASGGIDSLTPVAGTAGLIASCSVSNVAGKGGSTRSAKPPSNIQVNKARGDAFRDQIADIFRKNGYDVKIEQTKWTPFGRRRVDIEISKNGQVLGAIETKVGSSRYTPSQRAKDAWLARQGYIVNVVRDR